MADNAIGNHFFISLHRTDDRGAGPFLLSRDCVTVQRPGVDGTGVIRQGIKAPSFQMRSAVDAVNFAQANDFMARYARMPGLDPVHVIWGGIDYVDFGVIYAVLAVEPIRIRRISGAVNGLNPPSFGWVEALWTLQPMANP